jgi:uncharacterized protein
MLGFSFMKLLLLVGVIAFVWFGWRWYQRWELEQRRAEAARRTGGSEAPRLAAEDMVACRVCGTYVAPRSARACARPECPYPR